MIPRNHAVVIVLLIAAAAGFSAFFWDQIPDPAPTHWNWRGEIDGYGPRWVAAWLFPLILSGVTLLLTTLPLLGPFRKNFEQFKQTYGFICMALVAVFVAMHVTFLLGASGRPIRMGAAFSIITGALIVVIGNFMGKLRRNFYVGIRTPWTIANDEVWERTHRLGGPLFCVQGLISIVAGFVAPDWLCFVILIGGLIGVALWTVLYSLWVYRRLGSVDDLTTA